MALDVGDARIGIAITDPLGVIAQPYLTIDRANNYLPKLIEEITGLDIQSIVIGMPFELDGKEGDQAQKVKNFARRLSVKLEQANTKPINIVFVDERFSTAEAERILAGSSLKNKERSRVVDRISASVILSGYLVTKSPLK